MSEILPEEFENYRALILSGQIAHQDVPKLLSENPEFAVWYKERSVTKTAS